MKCISTPLTLIIGFIFLLFPIVINAQTTETPKPESEVKYPQFQFKGLFQGRFLAAMTDDVDVLGLQHSTGEVTKTSFDVKRMRVGVNTKISPETEVVVLVNLADFKSDPKGKVLENAYAKYTFSKYAALVGGQFRAPFGIEDQVSVDIIKSFDFSNQYYEFGKNGWTSFQLGASVLGSAEIGKIPIDYAITIVNGNGKDQEKDKDNGKQYFTRWVFGLSKKNKINLGLNGGMGVVFTQDVFAVGADITSNFKLADKLHLELQAEYKQGTNHNLYFSLPVDGRTASVSDYQMRGFYFLPNLRYSIAYNRLSSIEISCRYETFDSSYKIDSNVRQTYTPMISLEFGKAYTGRIELGFTLDNYEKDIPDTSVYSSNLFLIQLQCRL
ncbi:Phosphate-selective porin O and P [Flavobacterium aquidurense]|uniref:Porin n=1 Tax=Flavobacterium frigidimaris TaxID=262320 RepID=A0ABX4BR43_FLAFR|nr:porin [Flavobacterium frigidimaris]OXA79102.1 porin [Flavobacterium frigidimaris]SDY82154.1 Phosphate-selective porin O and P [Flavobacterium aquidurense]